MTGHVPEALSGRYLRNGPNPVSAPEPSSYHWFTGDGMVHGIRLRDGRAEWYRNRWVRSAQVARALGEEPRPGPVHAGMDFAPNTNVIGHAGPHLRHRGGGCTPLRAEQRARDDRPLRFRGHAAGRLHGAPEARPADGRALRRLLFLRVGQRRRGDDHGRAGQGALQPARRHGRPGERARLRHHPTLHRPARSPRDVQPGRRRGGRIVPLPLGGGVPVPHRPAAPGRRVDRSRLARHRALLRVPPDERLRRARRATASCVDVVRHPSMFRTKHLGPYEGAPTLERWHLDGHGGAVKEERLDDRGQEFPRVDERRVGLPHRYGYAVAVGESDDIVGTETRLLRHDFERGTSEARSFGRGASRGRGGLRAPRGRRRASRTAGCCCWCTRPTRTPRPCTSSTPTT